jgi:hypothetical protein
MSPILLVILILAALYWFPVRRWMGRWGTTSATRILPEFQQLAVGDKIPLPRGQGYPVAAVEPCRALVWI